MFFQKSTLDASSLASGKRGILKRVLFCLLVVAGTALVAAWYFYARDYGSYFEARRGMYAGAMVRPVSRDSLVEKSWLTVKNKDGFLVECGMLTPRDDGGKHPAIIVLGGKATGKYAVDYALDITGVVIIAVEYPYTPRETYTMTNFLRDVPAIRNALIDMVPSIMLVTDYLLTRGDVDTSRIVIVGYSFGAPFVPCIVAHDRRPAVVAMVYGGGDLRFLITHNMRRYEGEGISQFVGALGGLLLRPLEPMRYIGRVTPTPLIMINGTNDEQVPRRSAELLYNAAGEPKTITWLESRHVRPDNVELTAMIVAQLKRELEKRGVKVL
jgi:dienelactone hydrolase